MSSEANETAPLPPSTRPVYDFLLMFAIQFVQYCIVSISYRAMAQARYGWTFATDITFGFNSFFLIKRIAKSESRSAAIGYTLGGACGSLAAIWITKRLFGS